MKTPPIVAPLCMHQESGEYLPHVLNPTYIPIDELKNWLADIERIAAADGFSDIHVQLSGCTMMAVGERERTPEEEREFKAAVRRSRQISKLHKQQERERELAELARLKAKYDA